MRKLFLRRLSKSHLPVTRRKEVGTCTGFRSGRQRHHPDQAEAGDQHRQNEMSEINDAYSFSSGRADIL